jgi:hypothetical protein
MATNYTMLSTFRSIECKATEERKSIRLTAENENEFHCSVQWLAFNFVQRFSFAAASPRLFNVM